MLAFTFDDFLIAPSHTSQVLSRSLCATHKHLGEVVMDLPVMSASMSVFDTDDNGKLHEEFGEAMFVNGCIHVFSRGLSLDQRLQVVKNSPGKYGIAVSNKEFFENELLLESLDCLVSIDIANGAFLPDISRWEGKFPLMIGNFGNPLALSRNFATNTLLKFGIGSGSACSTRIVTGVGYPQAALIYESVKVKKTQSVSQQKGVVSDGGINSPADFVKALAVGADYVMSGRIFAGCWEAAPAPVKLNGQWYSPYFGMASRRAKGNTSYIEGVEGYVPYTGKPVEVVIKELKDALQSAMSYVDATDITSFQTNAALLFVTPAVYHESSVRITTQY